MAAHPVYVGQGEVGFLVTWPVCQPCEISRAKLRNTGLNKLIVNWSFFHNLCRYLCDLVHVIETIFHLHSFAFLSHDITRKDMTHSVISIDSIILNSMSTDSSAVKVLDS